MKFRFKELPGVESDYTRPVVPVTVEGLPRAPQLCLLDTGSLHNRFGRWLAESAGIDLSSAEESSLAVGGIVTSAREASVQLTIGDATWESTISFCDPWPFAFHLLGQEGFFRWFDVRVRAAHLEVEVTPET